MSAELEGGALLQITLKNLERRYTSGTVSAGLYDADLASIGYMNEYGHVNEDGSTVPPRPFMHTTFELRRQEWINILRAELLQGNNARRALVEAGRYMRDNIQMTLDLAPGLFKVNAPRTIRKKGFDYPLRETGRMRRSVRTVFGPVEDE